MLGCSVGVNPEDCLSAQIASRFDKDNKVKAGR